MPVSLMANAYTSVYNGKPELTEVQLFPLFVDKYTPKAPAKMFVSLIANENAPPNPLFLSVQLLPLLVDKNTPALVPAKIFVPLMANALTLKFIKPLLTGVQLILDWAFVKFADAKIIHNKSLLQIFTPPMSFH